MLNENIHHKLVCDSVVWSSGWVQSWEGLLSVVATDVSTTWAEVITDGDY